MALKDIVLKLVIDGKESLVTLDKLDSKAFNLQKTIKNTAGAMGLAFGSYQVIGFMKDSIALVQRENEVIGKLNATLESTKFAAGMTSKELIDLAQNLEEINNFKFDDKDIIEAEGLLLTFKKINKEVFPETMQLAMDLSVRFEQNLTSSIKMIGKAMEDPVRGLTAMRKAGIQFTEQQEEQIKAFIKVNDLMSAQKIILAELSTQVSGSAAASVDEYTLRVNRLGEAWEDVMLTTGKALTYFATDVYDFWDTIIRSIGDKIGKLNKFLGLPSDQEWLSMFGGKDDRFAPTGAYKFDASGNRIFTNQKTSTAEIDKLEKSITTSKTKQKEEQKDINELYAEQLEDDLWKARGDVLSDENIPMLGDYTSMRATGPEGGGMAGGAIGINNQLTQMDVLLSSIRDGFNSAGDAAVGAMTSSIQVFKQANSVLQVFINSLVQATVQSLALKAVSTILGFVFGGPAGGALGAAVPFASGGIVTRPTMGLVGEAGPEAVIPLNRYNNIRERPINITLAGELNVGLNDLRVRLIKVEESLNKYK